MRAGEDRALDRMVREGELGFRHAAALAIHLEVVAPEAHPADQPRQGTSIFIPIERTRDVGAIQFDAHVAEAHVLVLDRDAHQRIAARDHVGPPGEHLDAEVLIAAMAVAASAVVVIVVVVRVGAERGGGEQGAGKGAQPEGVH